MLNHPFNINDEKIKDPPYTDTGMTGSQKNIIPEYHSTDEVTFSDGDILKVFDKDGKLMEDYKYNKSTEIWEKQ